MCDGLVCEGREDHRVLCVDAAEGADDGTECDRLVLLKSAAARQCLARDCADRRRLRVANSDADADVPVVIVIFITVIVDGAESASSISSLQRPRFRMSRAQ